MKISIITICFNNESDIEETIKSVLDQTYSNIEYIIIDGGSSDNTINIINNYKEKISTILSEPDKGIYDAINKGIKLATGNIIGLIHAGDRLFNDEVIAEIALLFNKEKHIDAIYGNSIIVNYYDKIVRVNQSPEFRKSLFKRGWFPSHQSFYAKKELFIKYGMYSLKYKIAADYELLLRFLYFNDVKVKRLNKFIIKFSIGGTSTRSIENIKKLNKECIQAWADNGEKIPFYTIPLKLFRKIPQFIKAKLI